MRRYEKRFKADGSYDLWQFKTVWTKTVEDDNYLWWVNEGAEVEDILYIAPEPISFDILINKKIAEIEGSYEETRVIIPVVTVRDIVIKGGLKYLENIRCTVFAWKREDSPDVIKPYLDIDGNFHDFTMDEHEQMMEDIINNGNQQFYKMMYLLSEIESYTEDTEANRLALNNIKW